MSGSMEKPRLLDWLLTPVFLLAFLTTLLLFDLLFRLRMLLPAQKAYQAILQGMNYGILYSLKFAAGLDYKVIGGYERKDLPVIVVSNHQSMFDIPFLSLALANLRLRFVAKDQLAHFIPGVSIALRNGEHAIIDRENSQQAMPELERAALLSKERGFSLTVFPEGTRSRDGQLKRFKSGGIAKIVETYGEAVLLPVAIRGSWKIPLYSFFPVSCGNKVEVHILEAIRVSAKDDAGEYVKKAKEQIQAALLRV